jgi:hypothetical protein
MSDNLDDIDKTIAETERVLDGMENGETDDSETETAAEPDGDEEETTDRATSAGEAVGDAAKEKSANALSKFIIGAGSVIPFRERFMKKLMLRSAYKYHKMSGGDALALRARPNGQLEPTPVKWIDSVRPIEELEEGQPKKPGWKVKGEPRTFGAGAEGRNVDWFGRVPVILLDDDNPERFEPLDARVSECLEDPERVDALFETADINVTGLIDQRAYNPGGSGGEEVATDGGTAVQDHYDVLFGDIARGRLKDKLINVSSGEGLDGMRVSWRKVQEQRFESTSTEEMHNQEVRGYLAGKAGEDDKSDLVKKLMLYFILGILGFLALIFLGPPLVGGSSVLPNMSVMPPVGGL